MSRSRGKAALARRRQFVKESERQSDLFLSPEEQKAWAQTELNRLRVVQTTSQEKRKVAAKTS
jgi:hypothetical protein